MTAAVSQSASPDEVVGDQQDLAVLTPLARWLAVGTLVLATAIVSSRRLAGGLNNPASVVALIAVAAAGAGLIHLVDRLGQPAAQPGGRLVGWLTRGCLLVTLAAVGLFWAHSLQTMVTALLMVAAIAGLSARGGWRPDLPVVGLKLPQLPRWPLPVWRATPPEADAFSPPVSPRPRPPALAGRLVQWQERYLLADGREQLRGQLVVTLAAESRLATGHIGFCPALAAIPDVTVTTDYDALEVAVDAAEVLPWGIRVECRVEDPADEPVAIPIDLQISLPASPPHAFPDSPSRTD